MAALAQLASGDTEAYRATCGKILEQFSGTDDPDQAHWASWACLLAPDAVPDMTQPLRLAEMAAQANAANTWFLQTAAILLYRAGRLDEALSKLLDVAANPPSNASPAYGWFFLAMAQYRLGHENEAQTWLQKATEQAEEEIQGDAPWNLRATLQLLQKEAEALINGIESPSPATESATKK